MQKGILLLTIFCISYHVNAQYYYNDVVNMSASTGIYLILKKNNIKQVSATSEESDNTPTTGFVYSKIIKNNASLIITHIEMEASGTSDEYDEYLNDRLIKSTDSADNVLNTIEYTYDSLGNILLVKTKTDDTAMNAHNTELHKWFFNWKTPDSMIRIKDNTDTTIVHFKKDEHNNIAEELWTKKEE